jgi:hypothetical protein
VKVLPLKDIDSLYAVQSVHKLMLGLKMLPSYIGESYEAFYSRLDLMPSEDQETMLREAATFVKLDPDEMMDLLKFCSDANGVPYTRENCKSLKPTDIHEIIVAVGMEVMRAHKIKLLSDKEKKN